MSLVARHLEEAGIPTVIVGSAQDIVETAGVLRFLFVDYPLGNPMGRPDDPGEQRTVTEAALELLAGAIGPRMSRRLDLEWGTEDWRAIYMHVGPDNADRLADAGRRRREEQSAKKAAV